MTHDLTMLRELLADMIETNALADAIPMRRRILDGLDERARKFIRLIRNAECDIEQGFGRGALIMLSLNGGEPAIRDIIAQSERHRATGAVKLLEAAE